MSDIKHRERYLTIAKSTINTFVHLNTIFTREQFTTLRDGVDGWTALEILCHLRDFDEIFYRRAKSMIEQDNPTFKAYDHEAMVTERAYNAQDPNQVVASFRRHRAEFIAFFEGLSEEQWARSGTHPERGHFTMLDAVAQVATHDVNHLEQMVRVLVLAEFS
jgi:hypothetical protein